MNRTPYRRRWSAEADEARFRADVKVGDVWVRKVADRFRTYGLWTVTVPDVQVRGSFDARRDFRDDGDLFLNRRRVEVRSFGFRFTGAHDFPRATVQVELASVAGSKLPTTVAYLFVSRPTGAVVGLVGGDLARLARVDGVWNARRAVARDWLVAPAARLIDWDSLVNALAERCS